MNNVDVLAMIRAMAGCYEIERGSTDGWLVVAAVAELIEAAEPVTRGPACTRDQIERFRAVYARCKGGAV